MSLPSSPPTSGGNNTCTHHHNVHVDKNSNNRAIASTTIPTPNRPARGIITSSTATTSLSTPVHHPKARATKIPNSAASSTYSSNDNNHSQMVVLGSETKRNVVRSDLSSISTAVSFTTPEHSPFLSDLKLAHNPTENSTRLETEHKGNSINSKQQQQGNLKSIREAPVTTISATTPRTNEATSQIAKSVTPLERGYQSLNMSQGSSAQGNDTQVPPASSMRLQQQKQHITTSTMKNSTSTRKSVHASTSSPSGIRPLQPRRTSSNCSDTGSVPPPSLCSSAGSPQSNEKGVGGESSTSASSLLAAAPTRQIDNSNSSKPQQHNAVQHAIHIKSENENQEGDSSTNCHVNATTAQSASLPLPQQHLGTIATAATTATASNHNKNIAAATSTTNNSSTTSNSNNLKTSSFSKLKSARSNNNCSPVPTKTTKLQQQQLTRTPIRSPVSCKGGNGKLLQMDIPFGSPGIFLSPYVPSPPDSRKGNADRAKSCTPTNFARDFGKGDLCSSSFDGNNVLPWLSPTACSLFTPGGGIASAINTPGGMFASIPRSPATPNPNLSLPLANDPNPRKKAPGISSMICVSPLASRKNAKFGGGMNQSIHHSSATAATVSSAGELTQPETPINFREVFASPNSRGGIRTELSNEIPTLRSMNEHSNHLEKHMAERDVREDEDLNVLLKLAETTPNRKAAEPKVTSRPFRGQFTYANHPGAPGPNMYPLQRNGDPPVSLHLPYIGKHGGGLANTVQRQATGGVHNAEDYKPPQLPIRSNSSPRRKSLQKNSDKDDASKHGHSTRSKATVFPSSQYAPGPGSAPHPLVHPPHGTYSHHPPPHYMHAHAPYYPYPPHHLSDSGHPPPPPPATFSIYANTSNKASKAENNGQTTINESVPPTPPTPKSGMKRQLNSPNSEPRKRTKKSSKKGGKRARTTLTQPQGAEREKSAATITAINTATGRKNDKAASLASAILRGVTMRPSGKWQAQLYYAGKSRYIGVFDTREKAALAYEIAREKLKTDKPSEISGLTLKETEANVNAARKAAFEGVNENNP